MSRQSSFINFNLQSESGALSNAVRELERLIRAAGYIKRWHQRHTDHLTLIVLNLLSKYNLCPSGYVKYSRMNGVYARMKNTGLRYVPFPVSHACITTLTDALMSPELAMIDHDMGYHFPEQGRSKPSRMRATPKLIDHIEKHDALSAVVERSPAAETIILKDSDKNLLGYDDNSKTIGMRNNLQIINGMLDGHFIGLCVADQVLAQIKQRLLDMSEDEIHDEVPNVLDLSRPRLYRVFNNGSFDQGGRFYGVWWQSIPKEYRRYIRIDNIGTEELDFPGLHINLLYALGGYPLPESDPYIVEGLPAEARDFLKVALNVLINATDQEKGLRALRREFPRHRLPAGLKDYGYSEIMELFLAKHPLLAHHFGSGFGVRLQYLDSQIAEKTLLRLADKGIPALPVHDSFVVSRKHRGDLNTAMNDAIHELAGIRLDLKASPRAYADIYKMGIEQEVGSIEEYEGPRWTDERVCSAYYREMRLWEERQAGR